MAQEVRTATEIRYRPQTMRDYLSLVFRRIWCIIIPIAAAIIIAIPIVLWVPPRYEAESSRRKRPPVKERLVEEKGWKNLVLRAEDIIEFAYQPGKCRRPYRMIVLRKRNGHRTLAG